MILFPPITYLKTSLPHWITTPRVMLICMVFFAGSNAQPLKSCIPFTEIPSSQQLYVLMSIVLPMPYGIWHMAYAICHMPYAMCRMPCAICHMPYAICHMQYAIFNIQYAICNTQYAMCHTWTTRSHVWFLAWNSVLACFFIILLMLTFLRQTAFFPEIIATALNLSHEFKIKWSVTRSFQWCALQHATPH